MEFDPDGDGLRRLKEYLGASRVLSEFVGQGRDVSPGEPIVPARPIDQAYLDEFDFLQKVRDTTESAWRAWLSGRLDR
jgi:hypothetical protein